jgi:deazaflavin-dependent oxidoreductase (nitroreductase family)
MASSPRIPLFVRLSNGLVSALLRAGLPMGPMALLTVTGRRTGRARTVPVAVDEADGQRWIGSPFGEVNWVRNLRSAGSATLSRRGRTETITAVELTPKEAAAAWRQILPGAPGFVRGYFAVAPDASPEEFEREAAKHPLFAVSAAERAADRSKNQGSRI